MGKIEGVMDMVNFFDHWPWGKFQGVMAMVMVNFFDHWPWGKFQGVMVSALPPPPP